MNNLSFLKFDWDGYLDKLLRDSGGTIFQAAVVAMEDQSVLSSRNVELYQDEVDYLVTSAKAKTTHKNILSFGLVEYVVTSVQGQSFYCRSINVTDPGGLCIIITPKFVFAASYRNSSKGGSAPQAIPYIIDHIQSITQLS